ncbi:hypothetical protein [Clostridium sp.]|uniref:hypothetical protein n=1 Tax=Clostridium sp. TaxID=1506 RepID=UPI0026195BE7|nr:hypothetical protein [Clostridium sp.]
MSNNYYKKKKSSWTKVFQNSFEELTKGFTRNIGKGATFFVNCRNSAARTCIFILMGVTLLFSGIGFYSWVILVMLLIILQFV